jgi:hypothetical protein
MAKSLTTKLTPLSKKPEIASFSARFLERNIYEMRLLKAEAKPLYGRNLKGTQD